MKKILLFILLIGLFSCNTDKSYNKGYVETGTGWQQVRKKQNFVDSINFEKQYKIGGVTMTRTAAQLNFMDATSSVQTQINTKLNVSDTSNMLTKYARKHSPTFTGTVSGITYTMVGAAATAHSQAQSTVTALADSLLDRYTKAQSNTIFVPKTTTVNDQPLSGNISITADDFIEGETLLADTLVVYHNGKFYYAVTTQTITQPIYYVSFSTGNDANNGLTESAPLKYHPWMTGYTGGVTLKAGDKVKMKCGETWTIASPAAPFMTVAQSGASGNPIITTAYGAGNAPVINISTDTEQQVIYADAKAFITFDNLHITHHDNVFDAISEKEDGIYLDGTTNPCHDIIITNCEINNIPCYAIIGYKNCYNITVGDITKTSTATASLYSNNIHDFGYCGVNFEGSNPSDHISNLKVYYNYIHDATRATPGSASYGIDFTALDVAGSEWPNYCWANFNRITNIPEHTSICSHGGTYQYIQDNYIYKFGTSGITIQDTYTAALGGKLNHIYVDRNIIEQPQTGWIAGSESYFLGGTDQATADVPSDIYIRDNTCFYTTRPTTNLFYGMRRDEANGMTISGNTFYNGGTGNGDECIYLYPARSYGFRNVTITQNFIHDWGGEAIICEGAHVTGAITISDNIIHDLAKNIDIFTTEIPASNPVYIYNNTLLTTSTGVSNIYVYGLATSGTMNIRDNIIGRTTTVNTGYYLQFGTTLSGTLTCDYNLYWNDTYASPFYWAGTAHSFAQWQGYNFDLNSPTPASPQFLNGSGAWTLPGDFAFNAGPALNSGTNTGVTLDYYGHARVGNYDLGAIEKQ